MPVETLSITDREVTRRVRKEQRRRRDTTPTKTATKLLLEYFTLIDHGVVPTARDPNSSPAPATR
jgi:hypothetical protein